MSQLIDSASDSDSNSSASWVFVDDRTSDNQLEVNKYYLNCSSEPVQELTEKCLNSTDSAMETDSDGISIISESDENKQILQTDDQGSTTGDETDREKIQTVSDLVTGTQEIIEPININSPLGGYIFIFGIVVLASLLPLFFPDDELIANENLPGCESHMETNFYQYDDILSENMVYNEVPITDDYHMESTIKKCELDGKYKPQICVDIVEAYDRRVGEEISNLYKSDHKTENNPDINNFKSKVTRKNFDKNVPPSKNKKKDKNKKHYKDLKDESYNKLKDKYKKHFHNNELEKQKNLLKRKEKILKRKEKVLDNKERKLRKLEMKISKEYIDFQKSKRNKRKEKGVDEERNLLKSKKLNSTFTGEWYNNLHNARHRIRKQEQMANWVFERAEMRNKRRNKAHWYFNWMTDREQLRFKKGFKQFAY